MKTFLCSHLVTLRWNAGETCANLERISRDVATVNAEQPVPVGEAVRIVARDFEIRDFEIKGTVARCALELLGHEIEVALEEHWSPDLFLPDHMFDPDVMIAVPRQSL
jgi:hypothetical protein